MDFEERLFFKTHSYRRSEHMKIIIRITIAILIAVLSIAIFFYCNRDLPYIDAYEFDSKVEKILSKSNLKLKLERSLGYGSENYSFSDIPFLIRFNPFRNNFSNTLTSIPPQITEYKGDDFKIVVYHLEYNVCYMEILCEKSSLNKECQRVKRLVLDQFPFLNINIKT